MTKQPTELWTYAQISDLSGISPNTLRVWRLRGKLPEPDYEIGQWPAWKPDTVKQWWAGQQAPAATE